MDEWSIIIILIGLTSFIGSVYGFDTCHHVDRGYFDCPDVCCGDDDQQYQYCCEEKFPLYAGIICIVGGIILLGVIIVVVYIMFVKQMKAGQVIKPNQIPQNNNNKPPSINPYPQPTGGNTYSVPRNLYPPTNNDSNPQLPPTVYQAPLPSNQQTGDQSVDMQKYPSAFS